MKELKKCGFRYYQPKYCTRNIWYNKNMDMEVIKYSKKELMDMVGNYDLPYELIANVSNPKKAHVEEYFETIEEIINYLKSPYRDYE